MSNPALESKLLGELTIVVIRAKNLPDRSKIGKHNPYVVIKYRSDTKKTKVVKKGGQHPEFDEEMRFKIYEEAEDILTRPPASDSPSLPLNPLASSTSSVISSSSGNISASGSKNDVVGGASRRMPVNKSVQVQVWADDAKEPKIVGECSVDLTQVFKTCEQDDWYQMEYKDRYAGEIYLELTYFINDAPPMPKKVQKPIIPPKPSSAIPTFDGPAGFPLSGSLQNIHGAGAQVHGQGRIPPSASVPHGHGQGVGHAYHSSIDGRVVGMGGIDEWGGRAGRRPSDVGQNNRLSYQNPSFGSQPAHQGGSYPSLSSHVTVDSLNASLSSFSISSSSSGFPPRPLPPPVAHSQPVIPASLLPGQGPPPPAPPGPSQRYSISGAIPQSSSWTSGGYQHQQPPVHNQGTNGYNTGYQSDQTMPGGWSNASTVVPSSSFPQLQQTAPSYDPPPPQDHNYPPSPGYHSQSYLAPAPAPPQPSYYDSNVPTYGSGYQPQPPPPPPQPDPHYRSHSAAPSYIPPPLIDNRPHSVAPPRPHSQGYVSNNAPNSLPSGSGSGHYPMPTSSFHTSASPPQMGSYDGGQQGGRPLPLPGQDSHYGYGGSSSYNPPVTQHQQGGYVDLGAHSPAFGGQGFDPYGQQQQQPSYNPPPPQPSLADQAFAAVTQAGYGHQAGHATPQPNSWQGPPTPTPGSYSGSPPQTKGFSYLASLGVGDGSGGGYDQRQHNNLPSYGLPPRLPDSLLPRH